jgi:hypothetical protein
VSRALKLHARPGVSTRTHPGAPTPSAKVPKLVIADEPVTAPGLDARCQRTRRHPQMRAGKSANRALAAAMPALDRAIARCFEPDHPCC